ncbi:hypothetical protein GCM10010495_65030 [Kitasatospora herbaricolor]|uniref:hypothetical protein n=1 Tax=Kitasatospora herbaricolor TaxID=68217 RepID=UPI00174B0A16|nr:hypothetical protein [Kitasatospora herbaricolor]MDQ0312628.1 hypothetical protein [Kitasatospora herbaricolor]GGV38692.1 hypothetical protein GCM10010495_65030 [Kitasatospora herbaricolor]
MIANSLSSGAERTVAVVRRLLRFGYWGPLLLAVVLGSLATTPEGPGHGRLVVLAAGAGILVPTLTLLLGAVGAPAAGVPAAGPTEAATPLATPRRGMQRFRQPGNSVLSGCLLASGALVLGFSVPGEDYGLLAVGLAVLVLMPFAWIAWQVILARQPEPEAASPVVARGTGQRFSLWRWAAAPLLVGIAVLLIGNNVPREARFAISRPALTSFAERAVATGSVATAPAWIGGYSVRDTELVDGGVKFAVSGTGMFARHGFAYFPLGGPAQHRNAYTRVADGWYSWSGADHF